MDLLTIPVYIGKNEIFRTLSMSVEALADGDNIMLFIDDVLPYTGDVKQFNTGFIHLARKYYNKYGKALHF